MPKLGDALKNANAGLLREIGEVLRDPFFAGFLTRIDGVFESDVVDGRSSFSAKTRQVFAVKSGVDAFLDIARRNFCEATEAAHELIRALRERTGLESPRLDYTANGMFQIKVTRSDFGRYSVNASHIDASLPTLHAINALGEIGTLLQRLLLRAARRLLLRHAPPLRSALTAWRGGHAALSRRAARSRERVLGPPTRRLLGACGAP